MHGTGVAGRPRTRWQLLWEKWRTARRHNFVQTKAVESRATGIKSEHSRKVHRIDQAFAPSPYTYVVERLPVPLLVAFPYTRGHDCTLFEARE